MFINQICQIWNNGRNIRICKGKVGGSLKEENLTHYHIEAVMQTKRFFREL